MQVRELSLEGLKLIIPKAHHDSRGFFIESYQKERYEEAGIHANFCQDNHSFSSYGTVRGMHFQTQPGQAKLIRVGHGKIFDVAVDIRPQSPTFGKWEAVILDSQLHAQLFIPVGFAHGFCVLSDHAHVLYKVDSNYCMSTEAGFRWDDPDIAIQWPIPPESAELSQRDQSSPYFSELFADKYLQEQDL